MPRSIYTRRRGVSLSLCFSPSLGIATNNPLTGYIFFTYSLFYGGRCGDDDMPKSEGRTKKIKKEKERRRERGHLLHPSLQFVGPPAFGISIATTRGMLSTTARRDASGESLRPPRLSRPRGSFLGARTCALRTVSHSDDVVVRKRRR